MEEYSSYQNPGQGNSAFFEVSLRIKDLEEKQRLLKDRTLLIGKNLVEEREKTFEEVQSLKKEVFILKEEMIRMKDMMQRMLDQFTKLARKEELLIIQRQFDMFKSVK